MKAPKRILVPTDMSSFSLEALRYAQDIAELFGAEITVVRVTEETKLGPHDRDSTQIAQHDARKALVHLLMDHNVLHRSVQIEIRQGVPAREIVKTARDLQVDLIVMSTHGRTGVSHVLMGSVAEKVVRYASVPVLTIKPEEFHELIDMTEEDVTDSLHVGNWPEPPTN